MLITVCHLFPSEIGGQFISITDSAGNGSSSGDSDDGDILNTCFPFFFSLNSAGILVAVGNLDQLQRL